MIAALRQHPVGIMVARGDLAIEVGFERLAEVQKEILWLSEAAHIPVIWATQVLETLAKTGIPSRAEVTDAAMGVRAEWVMLNKRTHRRRRPLPRSCLASHASSSFEETLHAPPPGGGGSQSRGVFRVVGFHV